MVQGALQGGGFLAIPLRYTCIWQSLSVFALSIAAAGMSSMTSLSLNAAGLFTRLSVEERTLSK